MMVLMLLLVVSSETLAAKKKPKKRGGIDKGVQTEPIPLVHLQIQSLLAAEEAFDQIVDSIASGATSSSAPAATSSSSSSSSASSCDASISVPADPALSSSSSGVASASASSSCDACAPVAPDKTDVDQEQKAADMKRQKQKKQGMTAAADSHRRVASNWHELDRLRFTEDQHHWHLQADVEDNWWLAAAQVRPVQVMTVSAPCQPWSRAGSGGGLATADGAAMLRAADICGFLETPLVAIEQVEGFLHHKDYQEVLDGWCKAGYRVIWQETLDLLEVLPVSRKRHLILFAHHSLVCANIRSAPWVPFGVLLDLPQDILRQCLLDESQWEKYMDPWYLPPHSGSGRPPNPFEYRVKTSASRVGCLVAQYGSQHLLPETTLSSKGLHGQLLQHQGVVRFFSPAEVSLLQGRSGPLP